MSLNITVTFPPSRRAQSLAQWVADPALQVGTVLYRPNFVPVYLVVFSRYQGGFALLRVSGRYCELITEEQYPSDPFYATDNATLSLTVPAP